MSASIERSLALPTAYQQAGLSLLASVSTVLCQQHPDIPIHCRLAHSWADAFVCWLIPQEARARQWNRRCRRTVG